MIIVEAGHNPFFVPNVYFGPPYSHQDKVNGVGVLIRGLTLSSVPADLIPTVAVVDSKQG